MLFKRKKYGEPAAEWDIELWLQRMTSFSRLLLPFLITILFIINLIFSDFSASFFTVWAGLISISIYLGRFLDKKSRDEEAGFFSITIRPTDSEDRKMQGDLIGLIWPPLLLLLALFYPLLGK